MSNHIELTIKAPDKTVLNKVYEYCVGQIGEPDLDKKNLTAFIVVVSHGDRYCIKSFAEELGCNVSETIEENDGD